MAGRVRGLRGARRLVAACETKLLLLEIGGGTPREVPRAVLDGKAPTQLALLLNVSPLLLGACFNNQTIFVIIIMLIWAVH